jgi:hypothetical protein
MIQPPPTHSFVVAYLKLFRLPFIFSAAADSLAGFLVTTSELHSPYTLAGLAICSGGLFVFGVVLSEIVGRERNSQSNSASPPRKSAMPGAIITATSALIVSAFSLFCARVEQSSIQQIFLVWGLIVAGTVFYLFLGRIPSILGLLRSLNVLLGVVTAGALKYFIPWHLALVMIPGFLYVTALAHFISQGTQVTESRSLWMVAGAMIAASLISVSWSPVMQMVVRSTVAGNTLEEVRAGFAFSWSALGMALLLAYWIFMRAQQARAKGDAVFLLRDSIGGIILLNGIQLMSHFMFSAGLAVACLIIPFALLKKVI